MCQQRAVASNWQEGQVSGLMGKSEYTELTIGYRQSVQILKVLVDNSGFYYFADVVSF